MTALSNLLTGVPGPLIAAALWLVSILGAAVATARLLHLRRQRPDDQPRRFTRGQVSLFALLAVIALFLGGMGFWASFETVSTAAPQWGFHDHPWQLPLTLDLAILLLDGWDMADIALSRAKQWKRWPPRIFMLMTILLNVQGAALSPLDENGHPIGARPPMTVWGALAHALLVSIYTVVVAYARDTIQATPGERPDVIPWVRWILQPYPTWLTWRMTKLENIGWREARNTVAERLIVRSALKAEHAGGWSWVPVVGWRIVPIAKRALFRSGRTQGLSVAADAALAVPATAARRPGGRVAGSGRDRVAVGAADRSQALSPAAPSATGFAGEGRAVEGPGGTGVAAPAGRWVAAGLRVMEVRGLRGEVAAGVESVAAALDELDAQPFGESGNPSQDRVAELSGISRPTAKKWWQAMSEVFVASADGEGGPRLAVVEG